MREYRPLTLELKERIELILTEEVNRAEPDHIDLYVIKATNRIIELLVDEINYSKGRSK